MGGNVEKTYQQTWFKHWNKYDWKMLTNYDFFVECQVWNQGTPRIFYWDIFTISFHNANSCAHNHSKPKTPMTWKKYKPYFH
jgi:hypothetical protein